MLMASVTLVSTETTTPKQQQPVQMSRSSRRCFGGRSDFDETDLSRARMMKVAETRKGRAACVLRHHPWRWEPVGQGMQLGWPRLGGARAVGLTQFAGL